MCLPGAEKVIFFILLHTFETKRPLFSYDVCQRRAGRELKLRVGGCVLRYAGPECQLHINSSTKEAAQPSNTKVTKSQWGKVILKYQDYLQVFVLQKKKSLSYLLIAFPFPFGGTFCNEKRNEGGLFLTERFVNTVDFTGRADIRSSWRGEQKMSLINQKQNDWWPVSAANNAPQLIIQLQMQAGTCRMTAINGAWAILDVSSWLLWEMEHAGFTHEAYLESL